MSITLEEIDSSSDDELFALLGKELESRISTRKGSQEFIAEIPGLPAGLRAMAATYEQRLAVFWRGEASDRDTNFTN